MVRYIETESFGVHRPIYDRKRYLLHSSGFKDGFAGKILLVHDLKDPWKPEMIGDGWTTGQKDGEEPSCDPEIVGDGAGIHEGNSFGNEVTAGYRDAVIALFDLTDASKPEFK